jgi:hypothetical protein
MTTAQQLSGDHLLTVREVVADWQRSHGFPDNAERTLRGEMDSQPIVQCACAVLERVLKAMFE